MWCAIQLDTRLVVVFNNMHCPHTGMCNKKKQDCNEYDFVAVLLWDVLF